MKLIRLGLLLLVLSASLLFLTGCKTTILVHNATVKDIAVILDDYVGTHGFQITYRNDALGSYRLSLGNIYVPETSQTVKNKEVTAFPVQKNSRQPQTSYEETTWNTVTVPGHYVEATAAITLTQQDKDVVISIDTNDAGGSSLDDAADYIKGFGYAIDKK